MTYVVVVMLREGRPMRKCFIVQVFDDAPNLMKLPYRQLNSILRALGATLRALAAGVFPAVQDHLQEDKREH